MPLAPGRRLGAYEIIAALGAGGMGEVYRARDPRLGREVAIKVLPQHLADTLDARARFEREARTISQLNHPHICTVHDVGSQDGVDYLVMELVEGETLALRLERGALPLAEVLSLGRQIAEALARAHRAGVVHRDLKPGNVMLTRSGAKLLDFGLARSAALTSATATTQLQTKTQPLTAEGTIVGTFQYMAPEQLEGKDADARSDLWAFGCVLYEMATGSRAFAGESHASLVAAIMMGEPRPMRELKPVAPAVLEKLVRQCLHKDPESRLQSAQDIAFMLDTLVGEDPRVSSGDAVRSTGARRVAPVWLALLALALAAAAFVAGRGTQSPSGDASVRISTLSQGTRDSEASASRDGRWVAFNAMRQNGQGLWLMDMATRSEVKLTSGLDRLPRFTADGGSILFTRTRDNKQSLWRIPVLGGTPRLILDDATDADPSPTGDRITYVTGITDSTGAARSRLMVAKADGTGGRELWSGGSVILTSPRWSTDGKRIAVIVGAAQNAPNSILIVDAANGTTRRHPAPTGAVLSSPAWDGTGHGLLVVEGVGVIAIQRGASGRLYRLDTRSGKFAPLAWLENFPVWMDLLPDGRLVLSSYLSRMNLREVSMGARTLEGARWLTSGLAIDRQPVYSPDGKSVMFSSNRGGTLDLWEVSVETGEMHRVTDDPADDWDPEYGSDGQSIYWCSGRSGAFEIWKARRDGSAPQQLSRDSLDAENPSISPDNQWLVYSSAHGAKSGLWRVPSTGGDGELMLRSGTLIPDLSPDGRHVSVVTDFGTLQAKLGVYDLVDHRLLPDPVPMNVVASSGVQLGRSRFTPDGSAVIYIQARADGQPILVRRPLSAWRDGTGRVDTLFAGANEAIESFGFSPDGKRATVSVVDWLTSLTITERVEGILPPKVGK